MHLAIFTKIYLTRVISKKTVFAFQPQNLNSSTKLMNFILKVNQQFFIRLKNLSLHDNLTKRRENQQKYERESKAHIKKFFHLSCNSFAENESRSSECRYQQRNTATGHTCQLSFCAASNEVSESNCPQGYASCRLQAPTRWKSEYSR